MVHFYNIFVFQSLLKDEVVLKIHFIIILQSRGWRTTLTSKGNIFTSFWKLQCLNLTCTTHILMTSPTKVPKFLIPVQLLLMASVCSPFYLYHYLMFSFSSFYNYIVLMDVSLDIPYQLFYYYCTFLLYELTLSLYGIHSRVYSSSNSCFYLQLKVHCKIGIHPSHG